MTPPMTKGGATLRGALYVAIAVEEGVVAKWPHLSPLANAVWTIGGMALLAFRAFIDTSSADAKQGAAGG